jgi:hypothetical protein
MRQGRRGWGGGGAVGPGVRGASTAPAGARPMGVARAPVPPLWWAQGRVGGAERATSAQLRLPRPRPLAPPAAPHGPHTPDRHAPIAPPPATSARHPRKRRLASGPRATQGAIAAGARSRQPAVAPQPRACRARPRQRPHRRGARAPRPHRAPLPLLAPQVTVRGGGAPAPGLAPCTSARGRARAAAAAAQRRAQRRSARMRRTVHAPCTRPADAPHPPLPLARAPSTPPGWGTSSWSRSLI